MAFGPVKVCVHCGVRWQQIKRKYCGRCNRTVGAVLRRRERDEQERLRLSAMDVKHARIVPSLIAEREVTVDGQTFLVKWDGR